MVIVIWLPAPFYALLIWIGLTQRKQARSYVQFVLLTLSRVREGLRSGVLGAGDEWPYFLYDNNAFDAEDPWEGFFRSALLVNVSRYSLTV